MSSKRLWVLDLGREGDGASDTGTRALDGLHDFARGGVNDPVVVGFESDTDTLSSHCKEQF